MSLGVTEAGDTALFAEGHGEAGAGGRTLGKSVVSQDFPQEQLVAEEPGAGAKYAWRLEEWTVWCERGGGIESGRNQ